MSVNLAKKYSEKIAEFFTVKSVVDGNTNNDYRFTGAQTIQVYTPVTQALNDYNRTGLARYGTPAEMQDTVQELTLSRDRSFAITVDRGNNEEQMNVKEAGKMLALELEEQVIPEMDEWALSRFIEQAGFVAEGDGPTEENAVKLLSDAMVHMSNKKVPKDNRVIYIGWTWFGQLRTAKEYLGNDVLGTAALTKGAVGSFMGAAVVPVPDDYLKNGASQCYFLITHKNAVLQPKTVQDYFVKHNPPGINGDLLEGRFRYDAFVLGAKSDGVYAYVANGAKTAAPFIEHMSAEGYFNVDSINADSLAYTFDGSDPRYSSTAFRVASGSTVINEWGHGELTLRVVAYAQDRFPSDVVSCTVLKD